jgi:hypothetical protein
MEKTKRCDFYGKDEDLFSVYVPVKIWHNQLKSICEKQAFRHICFSCNEELWEAIGKIQRYPDRILH